MSQLDLNRGQIIAEGLAIAGRPDLTTNARLWLNLFLEEFYYTQDVEWLVKSLSSIPVTDGMDMPEDYRAAKSVIFPDYSGPTPIQIINNAAEYDELRRTIGRSSALPQYIYADHDQRKFFFVPVPDIGLSMDLKYFYLPEIPDANDVAADLDGVKWGMPKFILVDFVKSMAMEYNDDQRQDNAKQMVMAKIAMAKTNNRDSRAGNTKISMGKRFRKRFS